MREGVWRNRWGQGIAITQCEPVGGQRWTDGAEHYFDDGRWHTDGDKNGSDLVEFVAPLPTAPQPDQSAEIARLQTEVERLRAELLQSEARNTADAEAAGYLEGMLDNSREALRDLQEDHTAMDHRAEGARSAYLAVIKALWEMRR